MPDEPTILWRYGCTHRPPDYAAVPNNWREIAPHEAFDYGIIVYDRKLTDKEVGSYELTPLDDPDLVLAYGGVVYRITTWEDGSRWRYNVMQDGGTGSLLVARGTAHVSKQRVAIGEALREVADHVEDR